MTPDTPLYIIPGKTRCQRCQQAIHAEPTPDDSYVWTDTATGRYCEGGAMHVPMTAPLYFDTRDGDGEQFVPLVGHRVQLRHEVNRYPHFVVAEGQKGTVTRADTTDGVAVKMDSYIAGAEEWDNCIEWTLNDAEEERWLREDLRVLDRYDEASDERSHGDPYTDETDARRTQG